MSTKTIAEKLQIKPGATLWLSHPDRRALVEPLPAGVTPADQLAQASAALLFADSAGALRALLDAHAGELAQPSVFWVLYPKANRADINRDSLWPILSEYGMRPNSQIAVDEVWSALRFRPLKPGEPPFLGGAA